MVVEKVYMDQDRQNSNAIKRKPVRYVIDVSLVCTLVGYTIQYILLAKFPVILELPALKLGGL